MLLDWIQESAECTLLGIVPDLPLFKTEQNRPRQNKLAQKIITPDNPMLNFGSTDLYRVMNPSTCLVPIPFPLTWPFLIAAKSSHLKVSSEPPHTSDTANILQKKNYLNQAFPPQSWAVQNRHKELTCFSFVPTMEALLSSTNTTFFGKGGRSVGAK